MKTSEQESAQRRLAAAVARHQAGDLAGAASGYRQILARRPGHPDALHLLGVLHHQQGEAAAGVSLIRQALDSGAGSPAVWANLGAACRDAGDRDGAEAAFTQALIRDPAFGPALLNRGLLWLEQAPALAAAHFTALLTATPADAEAWAGLAAALAAFRPEAAEMPARRAVLLEPERGGFHHLLGQLQDRNGNQDAARQSLRRAIALEPAEPEFRLALARVLDHLGRLAPARQRRQEAITLAPAHATAHRELGEWLWRHGNRTAAQTALNHSLLLAPENPGTWICLAGLALARPAPAQAARFCRIAITLAPENATAWSTLAQAERDQDQIGTADAAWSRALILEPEEPRARLNQGLLRLWQGRLGEGLSGYAARFAATGTGFACRSAQAPALPLWRGESLSRQVLWLWPEQGIGDQVLFAALVPALLARAAAEGGQVVLGCAPRLLSLFQRSFPTATVLPVAAGQPFSPPSAATCHAAAGSLPEWLPFLHPEPPPRPWLIPDPAAGRRWQRWRAGLGTRPAIGLCWRSHLIDARRRQAYTTLADWLPHLASLPPCSWINLQAGTREETLPGAIAFCRPPALDLHADIDETAACLSALDLVISAPTAVGEIAAAVGTPTWRLTPQGDWSQYGTAVRPLHPWQCLFTPRPGQSLSPALLLAPLRASLIE